MSFGRNLRRFIGYGAAIGGGYVVATWALKEPASVSQYEIVDSVSCCKEQIS